ncbi:hypothetical protein K2173_008925 [Erythroxylum novogranatense]|uniref:snRNA-activating protein complex subunit n=1 Tax=Erythroxylum novogranatense TaxID=1862640 RepID=A0AAV8TSV5_9ROSI|nr:hypothetical protein K2173_008925 [Erythroxylum novogranatense]
MESGEQEVFSNANANPASARGGPLYTPNLIGPLTRVPDFQASLLHELQDLKNELQIDSSQPCTHDDISIDDLKFFTDEELVEMAMKEALGDKQSFGSCSEPTGENLSEGREIVVREREQPQGMKCNGTISKRKPCKRRGRKEDKHDDESYMSKVEEYVRIKQRQDEDRACARLHSLSCKIKKDSNSSSEKVEMLKSLRLTNSSLQQTKFSGAQDFIAIQNPEVVLCVEVYHNVRKYVKTQEFLVLGRQTLTEMRDKIYCSTDQVMQKAGQHDSSGYFLIEDVFYNDLRDPAAIDYSEPIFDWLRNSKDDALKKWDRIVKGELQKKQKAVLGDVSTPDLPQFRRIAMQKVRFCDLRFRLGAGYLYCHQGDCKHTIVIRDMRLIHPEDVQNRAAYPIFIFQLKCRVRKCDVCNMFRATKMTVDDKWCPENPCYFCNDCYFLLHHAADGSLLYSDFLVYDYVHD